MSMRWDDDYVDRVHAHIWQAVKATAKKILYDANMGILNPPKSGRIYHRKGLPSPHQASAPGEFPANWTGHLVMSSRIDEDPINLVATVVWPLDYAGYLQFGTRFMSERPFASMALMANAQTLIDGLNGHVSIRMVA